MKLSDRGKIPRLVDDWCRPTRQKLDILVGGVRCCSLNGAFIADSVRYRCAIFAIIRQDGHFIACNRGIFGTAMYHLYLHFFTHGETAPTPSLSSFT